VPQCPIAGDATAEDLNKCCCTFLFFYQYTSLSSHAVDSHQIYSGGSVVGKASSIDRRGQKCEIWHRFQHYSTLSSSHLKMQQGIWTLKQTCNAAMISPCLHQLWWSWVHAVRTPENCLVKVPYPLKLHGEKTC